MSNSKYKCLILTYQRAASYGAFLQAYALQNCSALKSVTPIIIDYYPQRFHLKTYLFPHIKENMVGKFLRLIKLLPAIVAKGRMHTVMQTFANEKLRLTSRKYITPDSLHALSNSAEVFLTGSDQIWDLRYDNLNEVLPYYLDFANGLKYSYSSSCGEMEYSKNQKKDSYKRLLNELDSFQQITVREQFHADDISKCLGKKCLMMLDPTFLLNPNEWSKIESKESYSNYILVYGLYRNKALHSYAYKLADNLSCKIVNVADMFDLMSSSVNIFNMNPSRLLSLIRNARAVVTDSFHGCALSLNYNKQLHIFMSATSTKRIENIVQLFHIENRIVSNSQNLISSEMDYESINEILNRERRKSNEYLKSIFS